MKSTCYRVGLYHIIDKKVYIVMKPENNLPEDAVFTRDVKKRLFRSFCTATPHWQKPMPTEKSMNIKHPPLARMTLNS